MTTLQEFFASRDGELELVEKLRGAGFSRVTTWSSPTYEAEGVFVNVQRIDRKDHVARDNPVPWGFVMELSRPLADYSNDHQLRTFFASLKEPRAYGLAISGPPRHQIEEYLPKKEAVSG
jgi:hypothetical protein